MAQTKDQVSGAKEVTEAAARCDARIHHEPTLKGVKPAMARAKPYVDSQIGVVLAPPPTGYDTRPIQQAILTSSLTPDSRIPYFIIPQYVNSFVYSARSGRGKVFYYKEDGLLQLNIGMTRYMGGIMDL